MTVQDVLNAALKRIGALAAGESPSAEESADAFACLNRMVDSWATERLTVYTVMRTTWTITANDGSYDVGATAGAGNVIVARPVYVQRITVIDTSQNPDQEIDLGPPLTDQEYAAIPAKALTADRPSCAYYDPTYPLATITFCPVPTSSTLQGVLYAAAPVSQFAAVATTVSLPPGYEKALVANLAIEIAPEYGRPVTVDLQRQADESKAAIKIANYRPLKMRCDEALVGSSGATWDLTTGTYAGG